jgi:hypothetical protein
MSFSGQPSTEARHWLITVPLPHRGSGGRLSPPLDEYHLGKEMTGKEIQQIRS